MKTIFLGILLTFISFYSISQDLIIGTSGKVLECEIIETDSINVYFKLIRADKKIIIHFPLNNVKEIIYEADFNKITQIPDSILYVKESGGFSYYHRGRLINNENINGLLSLNPNAYKAFKDYKDNKTIISILGFTGGFMIGWTIGEILSEKDPKWYIAGAGVGLIVLSIPMTIGSKNNLHNAIDIYNSGLQKTSMKKKEILFGLNNGGLGICIKF